LNGYSEREGLKDFERRGMLGGALAVSAGLALSTGVAAQTVGLYCFGAGFFYAIGEARCTLLYSALKATRDSNSRLLRMQDELIAREKLSSLGLLAAGVAHEINNPMAFVSSNVRALHRDLSEQPQLPEALREYVDDVLPATLDGIRRVNSIVADLRRFARNDSELPVQFDLNEEVRSALRLAQGELRDRGQVELELGEIPSLVGQPRQLSQVLLNLIVNAAQALPEQGGVVKVSTRMEAGEAVVQVSDNGVGMSQEALSHLFQPFFTTKPMGQGTGLGLAVAYGIVTRHKGRIEVDSTPGQGTRITVRLPGPKPEPVRARAAG
jgi:signal transduction histidine kinase